MENATKDLAANKKKIKDRNVQRKQKQKRQRQKKQNVEFWPPYFFTAHMLKSGRLGLNGRKWGWCTDGWFTFPMTLLLDTKTELQKYEVPSTKLNSSWGLGWKPLIDHRSLQRTSHPFEKRSTGFSENPLLTLKQNPFKTPKSCFSHVFVGFSLGFLDVRLPSVRAAWALPCHSWPSRCHPRGASQRHQEGGVFGRFFHPTGSFFLNKNTHCLPMFWGFWLFFFPFFHLFFTKQVGFFVGFTVFWHPWWSFLSQSTMLLKRFFLEYLLHLKYYDLFARFFWDTSSKVCSVLFVFFLIVPWAVLKKKKKTLLKGPLWFFLGANPRLSSTLLFCLAA